MLTFGDEEIEALLYLGGLNAPEISCASSHTIQRLCCDKKCVSQAACCNQDDCRHCEACHSACSFIDIKKLMKRAEGRLFFMRKAVADILTAENDLLNQLSASRKLLIQKIREKRLEEKYSVGISLFLAKGDPTKLKGKQVKDFLEKLADKAKQAQVEECILHFRKEGGDLVHSMVELRENVQ